jgi:FG-GAP-like repeat
LGANKVKKTGLSAPTTFDLNGDSKPDLAVANMGTVAGTCPPNWEIAGGGVSILLWNPTVQGTFLGQVDYPATDVVFSVTIADMNGDHKTGSHHSSRRRDRKFGSRIECYHAR